MTILVFPSVLEASVKYAREAEQWGRRVVGASSLESDPNGAHFDAWSRLPFIGAPEFFDELASLVTREQIIEIYTPHAPTFHFLKGELPKRLPSLRMLGAGPFKRQMEWVTDALSEGESGLKIASYLTGQRSPLPAALVGGILFQVENIYGECSREKVLALCGVVPTAPKGDVVEIGSLYGKSSYVLNRLAAWCGIGATICIDPWNLGLSVQTDAPIHIQEASSGWDWDLVQQGFLVAMLANVSAPFNYLRATSADAHELYTSSRSISSREFGETSITGSISILHIDGNHDEDAVAEDFSLWSPHVVPGGWIIFDDYQWPHGNGPRLIADKMITNYGTRVAHQFVGGGAMFVQLAG
jgi:hypothetical protein